MHYKIITLIGILSIPTQAFGFVDVSNEHPYKEAITYIKDVNIVDGYEDGTYKPNQSINRAEFTKIILQASNGGSLQVPWHGFAENEPSCFSDVPKDAWYTQYVCTAKESGIIGGYPDGTFRTSETINFVEAAKILSNVYGTDHSQSEPWYKVYVEYLANQQAIPTSISQFDTPLLRGEMAEMIYRLLHPGVYDHKQYTDF